MSITINVNLGTKSKRKLAEDAISFSIKHLIPRVRSLYIEIDLIYKLLDKEQVYGDCVNNDTNDGCNPKEFLIRVDSNLSTENFLKTIFHEMIHVKQYVRKELYDYVRKPGCRWKKQYFEDKYDDSHMTPWEIEAQKLENVLFSSFYDSLVK
jgi:hypothetical protein